jgi:pre-mRNA-splicing factor SYF1
LWIEFANFYENYNELENANQIYYKAINLEFKSVDELSLVVSAWAEMHIRHGNLGSATEIIKNAVSTKSQK